ncbi:glutathione S-transferase 1-1-like [Megachile rotundata]|uniref:glutathione S-transferase 1-1-like n=1 Tax=Megachile rotundata TaxID=143995 RepID=UPI000614BAA3|nr:PREDICTED: glutathione S-transferase 1-1-like [Megachile rotundata]
MPIDFYYFPPSPPCRQVLLLGKAIGVHFNLKSVNVLKGEQMAEDFVKINPQHTIPTINDNGLILYESRPIMGYLVNRYARNDSLYPKDPKKRAAVDQMLYFDLGSLFENISMCYFPVILGKTHSLNEERVRAVEKSCEILNKFLEGKEFVAGDNLTIADFSISTSICLLHCFDFDLDRYENVTKWYNNCKELMAGFEDVHAPGTKFFTEEYRANLEGSS